MFKWNWIGTELVGIGLIKLNVKLICMRSFFLSLLIISFIIFSHQVIAQNGYQSGYVVTIDKDTIYGELKDRSSEPFGKLYKQVRLKRNLFFAKRFSPKEISMYKIGNDVYRSIWLLEENVFLTTSYSSRYGEGGKVFVKMIVSGEVDYYQLEFRDADSGYYDYIPLYKKTGQSEMVRVTQGVLGLKQKQLVHFFNDYPLLVKKIQEKLIKDPVEIAELYNAWKISPQ
ncbi:hypothetical protein JKA74_07400 [Marivirga sp. S37H4]|uniref:Uncharacterized protein n=1 Tax=Marivirga aurantiaca TaxID=2802615 RepID=A0A934WXR7_9BACT|nr:hypothetical protein [Marivirga aurantiaca]MBK6264857.1 hypothetical protein [Marivirga aurantiaca]